MTIKQAIAAAGGAAVVAQQYNISPVSVYEWIGKNRLPADRVIPLARLTNWRFTPHSLDPHIYPHKLDGLPDDVRNAIAADDRRSSRERRRWAERRAQERKDALLIDSPGAETRPDEAPPEKK